MAKTNMGLMMMYSFASSSAYLAGIFTVASFAAMVIFFSGRQMFGPINDGLSALQMLFLIPVFITYQGVLRDQAPRFSGWLTVGAVLALMVIAVMQGALALGFVGFEQTIRPLMWLAAFLGLWWILTGIWSLDAPHLPGALAWFGITGGSSFILIAVGYLFIDPEHPLTAIGLLLGVIALPIWAFWLARLFRETSVISLVS